MAECDSTPLTQQDSVSEEDVGKESDAAETSFVVADNDTFVKAVKDGRVDEVGDLLDALDEEGLKAKLSAKDSEGDTVLHIAVWGGSDEHVEILQMLLDKGGDPNCLDKGEMTPLHLAARKRNDVKMAKVLVDGGADIDKPGYLKFTPLHCACIFGWPQIAQYLIEKGCDIHLKGITGRTPLFWAIDRRHKDVVEVLLKRDDWREAMRSFNLISFNEGTTPFRRMIEKTPELAELVMNKCTETNVGSSDSHGGSITADSESFQVTYDYEFLEDFRDSEKADPELSEKERGHSTTWGPIGFKKSKHPLYMMAQKDAYKLLSHPLVTSLLDYKWNRFGRYLFFTNLLIYLVFLAFLTAFALLVPKPSDDECVVVFNRTWDGVDPEGCRGFSDAVGTFLYVAAATTILLAVLRLTLEFVQMITQRVHYFLVLVNWLAILLYVLSIIFASIFHTPCLCVEGWKWQIGVIAVFLGWIVLISFLQKWPLTGIYVLMLVNIFYSFLRIAFLAFLLVVAFGLAFHMLFYDPTQGHASFSTGDRALVKTMTMVTGEFEYNAIFHQTGEPGEDDIEIPPTSVILWIVFLVMMPILLNNLLVGLAVGDVGAIREAANAKRLKLQTELVLSIEEIFPKCIRRHFIIRKQTVCPNQPGRLDRFFAYVRADNSDTGEKIAQPLNLPMLPQDSQMQNEKMTAEIAELTKYSKDSQLQIEKMAAEIAELTKHNRVLVDLITKMAIKQGIAADPETLPGTSL